MKEMQERHKTLLHFKETCVKGRIDVNFYAKS